MGIAGTGSESSAGRIAASGPKDRTFRNGMPQLKGITAMKRTMMNEDNQLTADLREKVREVELDNQGKPENGEITDRELSADVKKINPDCNGLDRG